VYKVRTSHGKWNNYDHTNCIILDLFQSMDSTYNNNN